MNPTFNQLLNQTEQLQPLLKRLPVVINFVLIIACAQLASEIVWMLVDDSETRSNTVAPINAASGNNLDNAKKTQQQAFRALTGAHLFGVTKTTTALAKTSLAPETKLNLVLKGVLANDNMAMASAIIARGANSKEEIYGTGDKIPGGITLKEIHPEHVILERQGQLETLRMQKDKGSSQMQLPDNNKRTSTLSAQSTHTLKKIRSDLISNPTSFRKYALPVVVRENGKQIGYRLQPQQNSDLLTQAGIEASDVITSINGKKLNSMQSSIGALNELRSAKQVQITVKRNGAEVPLNIQLQ